MDILSMKNNDNSIGFKKYSMWSDKMIKKTTKHYSSASNNNCCGYIDGYSEVKMINENYKQNYSDNSLAVWNPSGWIRVYCGPYRDVIDSEEPSRMMHVISTATTDSIIRDMEISTDYTIWMQIGGITTRRLQNDEHPFILQDNFLKKIGYLDASRRSRLCIDPDLKYLLRFYLGPAEAKKCKYGITKSGTIEILKGLVFPQWQKRSVAIVGHQLLVYPGNTSTTPQIFDLAGGKIAEHQPGYNRLILKVVPKMCIDNNRSVYGVPTTASTLCNTNRLTDGSFHISDENGVYNSTFSINSSNGSTCDREKVLFFGFEESWERDLWSAWLVKATKHSVVDRKVDICGSGLQAIPEIVFQSIDTVEELLAGQNKLQEIGLKALADFQSLRVLRLPGNGFKTFPKTLLNLTDLKVLDLGDNEIQEIPHEIFRFESLEELWMDRNSLTELPYSLRKLKKLQTLHLSHNQLAKLPAFLVKMRTLGLTDIYSKVDLKQDNIMKDTHDQNHLNPPLTKVSLRANQLRGSIILGNYGHLTELDVSENDIEILDLSALDRIETLYCSRNKIQEIILNGRVLRSLTASHNCLTKISIVPDPKYLRHLDISHNRLTELPNWITNCSQLLILMASNNVIHRLPVNFFSSDSFALQTLQLEYNNLRVLPAMPLKSLPIHELYLQNNLIEDLPELLFSTCDCMILLNVSSNKLVTLPVPDGQVGILEKLYATNNSLTDRVLDTLIQLQRIKVLHLAYNKMTTFPESCINNWPDLEELVLSGNKLQHLPDNLANMEQLKILRVHSNQLQTVPPLARISTLRVLDLAHNQLDKINLVTLVSKKLRFLDLSCNMQLQVDPNQFQVCRSQRPMSLVDVSGKNRSSLPIVPNMYQENIDLEPPWKVGFSETAGYSSKLYMSQLRLPCFCNSEGLFGIFDGEQSRFVPTQLVKSIPKILLDERTVKETAGDYMKYTLLSAHRELKQQGQRHGVSVVLCHISLSKDLGRSMYHPSVNTKRRFILRIASVGETSAIIIRRIGNVKLTPPTPKRQIGLSGNFPINIPDPEVCELPLGDQDEYLVIANKRLWDVMDPEAITREVRAENNVILAAKRVQDIAQSYGASENLSVIIVKFNNLGTDADYLMRELRQTICKKPISNNGTISSSFCKCGCCCESNNNCYHSGAALQFVRQSSSRSDRSSPSGQSDNTASEISTNIYKKSSDTSTIASRRSSAYTPNERRSLRGGVVRAVRARIEEEEKEREREESDSALSEEQFKCWEYMLEQNTQLLFDKELNTISKSFSKNKNLMSTLGRDKALSASTPMLSSNVNEHSPKPVVSQYHSKNGSVPLLSRQFGSARSFHPQAPGLFKSLRFNSNRLHQSFNGGPNAAYFGSLQRLMPYNLEYDFAAMHERLPPDDSLEYDSRMQQYWGVATTEL